MLWRLPVDTMSVTPVSRGVCITAANHVAGWCWRRWWWQFLLVVLPVLLVVPKPWPMELTGSVKHNCIA